MAHTHISRKDGKMKKKNTATVDDILMKVVSDRKNLVKELKSEEESERPESIDDFIKDVKLNETKTDIYKKKFIDEIKNGLGDMMMNPKEEPKPSLFKKIFTIFSKR